MAEPQKREAYFRAFHPLKDGDEVQFVGCYVTKWGNVDKPTIGFAEIDESEYLSEANRHKIEAYDNLLEAAKTLLKWDDMEDKRPDYEFNPSAADAYMMRCRELFAHAKNLAQVGIAKAEKSD